MRWWEQRLEGLVRRAGPARLASGVAAMAVGLLLAAFLAAALTGGVHAAAWACALGLLGLAGAGLLYASRLGAYGPPP